MGFQTSLFILIGGFNDLLSIKFESLKLWKVHRPYPYTIQRSATLNTREIFPSTISAGRPPLLHTPLCSGASGFWSFTVQGQFIICPLICLFSCPVLHHKPQTSSLGSEVVFASHAAFPILSAHDPITVDLNYVSK